jgi:hypothetical protein
MRGLLSAVFLLTAQDQPAFHADASLVTVPVIVTDADGLPVRDLKAEEFRPHDNGCSPRDQPRLAGGATASDHPDPQAPDVFHQTFIAVKQKGTWLIRVHQTTD